MKLPRLAAFRSGPDVSRRAGSRPAYLIQALQQRGTCLTISRMHGPLLCGEVRECAAVIVSRRPSIP
ncbi:unnamed protein product [Penicillium roqueforti FM164]|uniref:Genomic scaffold, ProqFM164S03 n=1 Tax=Penicillium roqueforti (strain FM164) TaxID=1365484 RepID=W6QBU6_PENRF|nr:unnamed protein product [Penicillium roqueforti FM164]